MQAFTCCISGHALLVGRMKHYLTIRKLSEELGIPVRTLRTLHTRRLIPYLNAGHRTKLYDPAKVAAALERLEVKAVS